MCLVIIIHSSVSIAGNLVLLIITGDELLNTQEHVDAEEGEEVESAMVGQMVEEEEADTTQGMENQVRHVW